MIRIDPFALRGVGRPYWMPRRELRPLLAALRDAAARLMRGRARPDVLAETLHGAARAACWRQQDAAREEQGRRPARRDADGSDAAELEAFAGAAARAGLRLARGRLRARRPVRRS